LWTVKKLVFKSSLLSVSVFVLFFTCFLINFNIELFPNFSFVSSSSLDSLLLFFSVIDLLLDFDSYLISSFDFSFIISLNTNFLFEVNFERSVKFSFIIFVSFSLFISFNKSSVNDEINLLWFCSIRFNESFLILKIKYLSLSSLFCSLVNKFFLATILTTTFSSDESIFDWNNLLL